MGHCHFLKSTCDIGDRPSRAPDILTSPVLTPPPPPYRQHGVGALHPPLVWREGGRVTRHVDRGQHLRHLQVGRTVHGQGLRAGLLERAQR